MLSLKDEPNQEILSITEYAMIFFGIIVLGVILLFVFKSRKKK